MNKTARWLITKRGYYGMDGKPISRDEWIELNGSYDNLRVACCTRGDVTVSTVLLGLDHGWGDGPPLIFETMIFGGAHDRKQWRYSTLAEAKAGHEEACQLAFGGTS